MNCGLMDDTDKQLRGLYQKEYRNNYRSDDKKQDINGYLTNSEILWVICLLQCFKDNPSIIIDEKELSGDSMSDEDLLRKDVCSRSNTKNNYNIGLCCIVADEMLDSYYTETNKEFVKNHGYVPTTCHGNLYKSSILPSVDWKKDTLSELIDIGILTEILNIAYPNVTHCPFDNIDARNVYCEIKSRAAHQDIDKGLPRYEKISSELRKSFAITIEEMLGQLSQNYISFLILDYVFKFFNHSRSVEEILIVASFVDSSILQRKRQPNL